MKAILFDLDGTLVDTAPDMVASLNHVLQRHQHPTIAYETASMQVSNGARGLFKLADESIFNRRSLELLVDEFLQHYAANVCNASALFPGMAEILSYCFENKLRWGVVTNKPLQLSRALLLELDLLDQCAVLLGGDSLAVKKPNPAPLLHASMVLNLAASDCIYVGDHVRDIVAGRDAGMHTAAASWGYIAADQSPLEWGADWLCESPDALLRSIKQRLQ